MVNAEWIYNTYIASLKNSVAFLVSQIYTHLDYDNERNNYKKYAYIEKKFEQIEKYIHIYKIVRDRENWVYLHIYREKYIEIEKNKEKKREKIGLLKVKIRWCEGIFCATKEERWFEEK